MTSAEKHVQKTVVGQVGEIVGGTAKAGDVLFNAANDGIGISPDHESTPKITPEIQAAVDAALTAMKATPPLMTCPTQLAGKPAPVARASARRRAVLLRHPARPALRQPVVDSAI